MSTLRAALATLALVGMTGAASAEALSAAGAKPLAELLNDGYAVAATTGNGRSGDVVLIVRKEAKTFACVLTDMRGETYGEAKAKPSAQPCLPLN